MLNGGETKRIKDPVMPQRLSSIDSAGADEYGCANPILLQDRKCIVVVIAVSVVERDCHRPCGNVSTATSLDQFQKGHHAIAAAQKVDLFLKHVRMNRCEERMRVGRNFVIREHLEP